MSTAEERRRMALDRMVMDYPVEVRKPDVDRAARRGVTGRDDESGDQEGDNPVGPGQEAT